MNGIKLANGRTYLPNGGRGYAVKMYTFNHAEDGSKTGIWELNVIEAHAVNFTLVERNKSKKYIIGRCEALNIAVRDALVADGTLTV